MFLALCLLQQGFSESEYWTRPISEKIIPVTRSNDKFPLSDQRDNGKWEKYEPMSDEFNGSRVNPDKWTDTNPEWAGRQPGFFDPLNVTQEGGCLNLLARNATPSSKLAAQGYKQFSTAAVKSVGQVLYGYFEVRAQPMRSHVSSAFFFYNSEPSQWTEIDVFEIGGGAPGFERKDHMSLHVFHSPQIAEHRFTTGVYEFDKLPADDFHVYGLEWDANDIKWYVDGALVRKGRNLHWHQPLSMNFDGETMPDWFGLPVPSELPATYKIDYVRSWKRASTR